MFVDGQGLFVALRDGAQDEPMAFAWRESEPGTLELAYEAGAVETLGGVAFDGEGAFDATSSFDGALSCELVTL